MKRAFPQTDRSMSCYSNSSEALTSQADRATASSSRRTRTSAAMIGLALSMGASSLLLPRHGDSAAAAEPKPAETSEPVVSALPQEPSNLRTIADVEGFASEYAVQPGETLWVISRRYQVTPELLAAVNGLSLSSTLHVGQILRVPSAALGHDAQLASLQPASDYEVSAVQPVQESQPQTRQASYYGYSSPDEAVAPSQSQDSLSAMREKRDRLASSLNQLRLLESSSQVETDKVSDTQAVNSSNEEVPLEPVQVSSVPAAVGADESSGNESSSFSAYRYPQEMRGEATVPSDGSSEFAPTIDSPAESVAPESSTESSVYQVALGDTLNSIAAHYGVSPSVLAAENDIENPNFILLGQLLHIPEAHESETLVPMPLQVSESGNPSDDINLISSGFQNSEPPTSVVLPSVPQAVITPSNGVVIAPDVAAVEDSVLVSDASSLVIPESPQNVEAQLDSVEPETVDQVAFSVNHSQTLSNPYVEGLRAEIMALRDRYRSSSQVSEPEASYPQQLAPVSSDSTAPVAVSVESSQPQSLLATTFSVESSASVLESEPVSGDDATEVAVAPLGYENYESLVTPMTGRLVSPDLPPLLSADAYLPSAEAEFSGYIWPASGMLTSGYGWRWGRMHQGIDIAAPVGTPVMAAAPGVVEYSGWNSGGYGNMVEIRHPDGSMTRYAHNSRNLVQVGDEVEQGQQIAEMGSTGYSTGPHVHFEVHLPDQGTVNPIAYLP